MLNTDDLVNFEEMDTGIEDDYVERIFHRLSTGNHRLYGLFLDNQMVSMGGYTIFADHFAMLGRLRSDRLFRGNNFATELISYIIEEALQLTKIQWIGANTQMDNLPARRVLEKLGLIPHEPLHGAITKDTSALETGSKPWTPIHSLERKKFWLNQKYLNSFSLFPYEVYYSFPASKNLFQEHDLMNWSFYENEDQTRFLITKKDRKGDHYLHIVYPWSDISSQKGLWETISTDFRHLTEKSEGDTYIWMDLSVEAAKTLPSNHNFELSSPWVLYEVDRNMWDKNEDL